MPRRSAPAARRWNTWPRFTGLVVIGLQVGYLPTLYAAFNRRETEVSLLGSRSGVPAWGPAAIADNTTLRGAALASGKVTAEQFDSIVKPTNMIGDGLAGA
jgi:hypothetical protein